MLARIVKTVCLAILLFAIGSCQKPASSSPQARKQSSGKVDPAFQDEINRKLALGVWTDNYKGRRVMSVRADGTATMVVEPKGLSGTLFAKRLEFDERWSIKDGHLRLEALGGRPKARVALILKSMGTVSNNKILELTKDRMLLLDSNGKTRYDWRRLKRDE